MKKRNIILIIILALVWLVVYHKVIIKIPFCLYISSLQLPEDTVNVKTKVEIDDIEGWHITAERLIYTNYSEDKLEQYIEKKNGTYIEVINYFDVNPIETYWYIFTDEDLEVDESEQSHYFVVHYSTLGSYWFEILSCLGIVSTILICIFLYRIMKKNNLHVSEARKRLRERTSEVQNSNH